MKVPKGFCITGKNPNEYVLKLNQNVYGQKQAGRFWNKYLEKILIQKIGFKQSKLMNVYTIRVKPCMYYTRTIIYWQDPTIMK